MPITVLVTGATGLLGRSVFKHFSQDSRYYVVGTGYSRASGSILKVDLTNEKQVQDCLESLEPQVIIHCAAEKRPDVAARNEDAALEINVKACEYLARQSQKLGSTLIYISTDYVFDGTQPPYEVSDEPNPLNFYVLTLKGKSKYLGELAVRKIDPTVIILRVPVLYGQCEKLSESAVNILLENVKGTSKTLKVDHYHVRYPTCVDAVSRVLLDIVTKSNLQGIYHFSSEERLTKYEMCLLIGNACVLDTSHLIADTEAPKEPTASRPYDAHLSTSRLKEQGISVECSSMFGWFSKFYYE